MALLKDLVFKIYGSLAWLSIPVVTSCQLHSASSFDGMAIVVDATLIIGKNVSLKAGLDSSVESLQQRARRELRVGRGRLFDSFGHLLDGDATLEAAGLQTGDCLTLRVGKI